MCHRRRLRRRLRCRRYRPVAHPVENGFAWRGRRGRGRGSGSCKVQGSSANPAKVVVVNPARIATQSQGRATTTAKS